jgi:hypothetical protein
MRSDPALLDLSSASGRLDRSLQSHEIFFQPSAHRPLDACKRFADVLVHRAARACNDTPALICKLEAHRAAVIEVAKPSQEAIPLEAIEDARDGLRLLFQVVGYQMGLRPVERIDRHQRQGLDEGHLSLAGEASIEFPNQSVRRSVESGHETQVGAF